MEAPEGAEVRAKREAVAELEAEEEAVKRQEAEVARRWRRS